MNPLLKYLLNYLLSFGTMFFAAAAVLPEVSDGNSGDGGEAIESRDGGDVDSGATGAGDDAADVAASDSRTDPAAAKDQPQPAVGQKLPEPIKAFLKDLQAKDPKAHGFLKDVLFRDRTFKQELPGGLPELKALKETVAAIGEGGIDAIKTERAEWSAIDEAYNAADPKFLDIMVDANPESFNKIAPMMINKFAATDPEGYQRSMAGIFVSTLTSSGVTANLRFLNRAIELGDKEGAQGLLKEINDFMAGIEATSKTQPKVADKNPDLDAREKRIKDAEDEQWVRETSAPINNFKTSMIRKELAQYTKGQQVDDETYEAIEGQALKYLDGMLMSDPKFKPTFNSYYENKDRDGVTKFMRSKLEELLPSKPGKPGPVEKAYKLFFRGNVSSSAKPRTAPPVKPGAGAAPAPQGWAKVATAPKPHEIDLNKSPWEMRFKLGAVLKSGKKVYWGQQAPA